MKTKHKILFLMIVCLMTFISCQKPNTTPSTPADPTDQFVGNWLIDGSYIMTITKSSSGVIQLDNFMNLGIAATSTVANDSFYIPQQTFTINGGAQDISGGGHISGGNTLSFSYYDDPYPFRDGKSVGTKK